MVSSLQWQTDGWCCDQVGKLRSVITVSILEGLLNWFFHIRNCVLKNSQITYYFLAVIRIMMKSRSCSLSLSQIFLKNNKYYDFLTSLFFLSMWVQFSSYDSQRKKCERVPSHLTERHAISKFRCSEKYMRISKSP